MGKITELELLIVVKSYPNPSASLGEANCVMCVHRELGFVRLYPIPFRQLEDEQKFPKYARIRVQVQEPKNDPRPNTFRPQVDTIEVISEKLPTNDYWKLRKDWVMPFLNESMCEKRG